VTTSTALDKKKPWTTIRSVHGDCPISGLQTRRADPCKEAKKAHETAPPHIISFNIDFHMLFPFEGFIEKDFVFVKKKR